jgi:hypothetical protein
MSFASSPKGTCKPLTLRQIALVFRALMQGKLRPLWMLFQMQRLTYRDTGFDTLLRGWRAQEGRRCDQRRLTPDSIEEGTSTRSIRDYDNIE